MNKVLEDETINRLASWLTIITAIISLANFVVSINVGNVASGSELDVSRIEAVLPFRFVLYILLETALAYAFGRTLIYFEQYGQGIPLMLVVIVSLVSAWTSLFNAQWLFLGSSAGELFSVYGVKLLVLMLVALGIAMYFISVHFNRYKENFSEDVKEPSAFSIQIVAFFVMFFLVIYA
ncbi:hypothetical protein E5115_003975 [Vibrio mimicus]